MADITEDKLIKAYIEMRDAIKAKDDEAKNYKKDLKGKQDQIALALRARMQKSGLESLKSDYGIVFETTQKFVGVEDFEVFLKWIIAQILESTGFMGEIENWEPHINRVMTQAPWQFFNRSVGKSAALEYMDENEGELPPGLKYSEETVIQVRKS